MTNREFSEYTNDNGGSQRAHVVTADTAGEVHTPGGGSRQANPGDVLTETGRPGEYWVGGSDSLEGWSTEENAPSTDDATDDAAEDKEFNPSDHTAVEVRQYLEAQKAEGNREEFNRVTNLEKNGDNRSTASVDFE